MARKSPRTPRTGRKAGSATDEVPDALETPVSPATVTKPDPSRWKPSIWTWLALTVTIAATVVRCWDLGGKSLWFDEALSIADSNSLQHGFGSGYHPPTFYYLLHAWLPFAEDSDALVRLVSAIPGSLTVAAVFVAGWRLCNERAGVVAASVLAVASLHVEYSQEVRMYALATFFVTVATVALAELLRRWPTSTNRTKWLLAAGYTGAAYLAIGTHYLSLLPIAGQAIGLLVCFRECREIVVRLVVLQVPAILAGTVAIFGLGYGRKAGVAADFLVNLGGVNQAIFSNPGDRLIALPKSLLVDVLPGTSLKWLVVAWYRIPAILAFDVVALAASWFMWKSDIRRPIKFVVLFAALLPMPILIMMVGPEQLRFYLSLAPMMALLLALGLESAPSNWIRVIGLATVLIPSVLAVSWYFSPGMDKQPWRRVAALISDQSRSGDAILINEPHQLIAFERYFTRKPGVDVDGYPEVGGVRITPDNTDRWLLPLVRGRDRVWFVRMTATASISDPQGIGLTWLNENMKLRSRVKEPGYNGDVEVFLFER